VRKVILKGKTKEVKRKKYFLALEGDFMFEVQGSTNNVQGSTNNVQGSTNNVQGSTFYVQG